VAESTYPTLREIRDTHAWKLDYERYLPLSRFVFRPLGFLLTWFAIRIGLTSETVSWLSGFVALMGFLCLISKQVYLLPIGICLLLFFNLLDCVDGSIARSMKTENPYGTFLDIMMAWVDMGFWGLIGIMAYHHQGLLYYIDPLGYGPIFWLAIGGLACYFYNLLKYVEMCFDRCLRNDWNNHRTKNDIDVMDNSEKQKIKAASRSKANSSPLRSILCKVNHNLRVRETHYFLLVLTFLCQIIDLLLIAYLFYYFMHTIILIVIYSIRGKQLLRFYKQR
jgi:hypothetical protein